MQVKDYSSEWPEQFVDIDFNPGNSVRIEVAETIFGQKELRLPKHLKAGLPTDEKWRAYPNMVFREMENGCFEISVLSTGKGATRDKWLVLNATIDQMDPTLVKLVHDAGLTTKIIPFDKSAN